MNDTKYNPANSSKLLKLIKSKFSSTYDYDLGIQSTKRNLKVLT